MEDVQKGVDAENDIAASMMSNGAMIFDWIGVRFVNHIGVHLGPFLRFIIIVPFVILLVHPRN